ncbi:mechanosensitive ion channel protein 10 [Ziziphus jujuba]|uniref:Mechanosensitive ion channel protein n=2 Tax=Ziziphus jujuba TaxID=326968 RepID=A0ABM3IN66_ZIZJJ|nr:mechanosensitive ion channel protein 10 [Ziziphus jujuba]KAH7523866.1 hypothetical protein FEM48_Zijuj06G0057400 [Ziziphus jujuba var. spinosa]
MEANEKAAKGGEINMSERKRANGNEVVVEIRSEEAKDGTESPSISSEYSGSKQSKVDLPNITTTTTAAAAGLSKSVPLSCPSPEIAKISGNPNKPPKIPTTTSNENVITRRKSLNRSLISKPKSRFGEPSVPIDTAILEDNASEIVRNNSSFRSSFSMDSPNNRSATARTVSITQKSSHLGSPAVHKDNEDEEIYKKIKLHNEKRKGVSLKVWIEWVFFVFITGCLVASLTIERLKKSGIWGLELWKWFVLVMVTFCGMLVTNWFMRMVVFVIEKNFLLKKKVMYFVHGLKKVVQVHIWLSLILITWHLLFEDGEKRSKKATKILSFVTWTLVTLLIGSFLWLIKTLMMKILASNFHVNTFFDRIQESIFNQYVLQTLSGPPLVEMAEMVGREPRTGHLSFRSTKKGKPAKDKQVIDMGKVYKMKQEKVSAWTMKVLVDAVASSGLSTISNTLDEVEDGGAEQTDKEITNEMEATAAAYYIFRNVAQPGCNYIDEDDLLRFMIKEEVDLVFPMFEGAETGKIDRQALTDWVIKVYKGRKALAHALSDTKTAVNQLNKLLAGIIVIVTIVVWLLLMGIATTKVLVFLSTQLVAAAFVFGNTCKTIFEALMFVFIMHPFDVGDRCVIEGVQMLVEEMNILNTVFLKLNNEKVYYPNSVLATKPISNYYRSPDMGDGVDFSIDFMTPVEKIGMLKEKIKMYLERTPQHWYPNFSVVVNQIENMNEVKMSVYVTHTMTFQDWGEKNDRRTELIVELKKIFEELNIRYHLLPQAVHLSHVGSEANAIHR